MALVLIPAGEFLMGSPASPRREELVKLYRGKVEEYQREFPQHPVRISKPFWLGKFEVTQEQWHAVMGANPSRHQGAKNPVDQVSWHDCQGFLAKLNQRLAASRFRMPTEAEWEYACRAGTATQFCFGDAAERIKDYAWFKGNSAGQKRTHPAGQARPNAWGLYDMHGNLWEWCGDWYERYTAGAQGDPKGPAQSALRVQRGGEATADATTAVRRPGAAPPQANGATCTVFASPELSRHA